MPINACEQLVQSAEQNLSPTPFGPVYKLEAIVKRASSPESMLFTVSAIFDQVTARMVTAPDFSIRVLIGGPAWQRMPWVIGVCCAKRELALEPLNFDVTEKMEPHVVAKLASWSEMPTNYLIVVGYPHSTRRRRT